MTPNRNTATHPEGTTYDVLVMGHAARRRGVSLDEAKRALRMMQDEGSEDAIMVAHLPNGERIVGCGGDWEL